jgi:hypothetical protein
VGKGERVRECEGGRVVREVVRELFHGLELSLFKGTDPFEEVKMTSRPFLRASSKGDSSLQTRV